MALVKMDCRSFSTLGGDKISSWGRENPVGAPKEKLPYAPDINKEPTSGEIPFVKRTVLRPRRRSRRASGLCGTHLPNLPIGQASGLPTSFLQLFSFWERKKLNVPPFPKGLFTKVPSADKNAPLFFKKIF